MCRLCIDDVFGFAVPTGRTMTRGRFIAGSAALAGLAASGWTAPAYASPSAPVTVFSGGPILTMNDAQMDARAIAISGTTILAVGDEATVNAAAGPGAQRVNLDGRTLMPGLIDPHQHPVPGGIMLALLMNVNYDTYKTKAAVIAALKAKAAQTPPGEWIYAGYYDNVLQGGNFSMTDLDAVSTAHNVFVYYISMHTATANGAAFAKVGVTAATPDIPGGGRFGKDANGALDGMIYEPPALTKFMVGLPKLTPAFVGTAVSKFLYTSAALGCTMVHEAGALAPSPNIFDGYKAIMTNSPLRYSCSPMVDYLDETMQFIAPYGKPGPVALEIPGTFLSFYAVKLVSDGSPQNETALQSQPYLHTASVGNGDYTAAQINALVLKVKNAGWTVSIHSNGDGSLDLALDAIEAAYGSAPPAAGINRIEHCSVTRPEQLSRMKRLGVQPSHLMNNIYYYGAAYRDQIFGPERAERFNPAGEFLALGVPFSIHSDSPCSPVAPLREIGTAVTRRCETDGSVVGAKQAVPVIEALKAMTTVAAAHCGLGAKTGSLMSGKYADLVLLESDPRAVDPAKIGAIKVSETWVGGGKVTLPPS